MAGFSMVGFNSRACRLDHRLILESEPGRSTQVSAGHTHSGERRRSCCKQQSPVEGGRRKAEEGACNVQSFDLLPHSGINYSLRSLKQRRREKHEQYGNRDNCICLGSYPWCSEGKPWPSTAGGSWARQPFHQDHQQYLSLVCSGRKISFFEELAFGWNFEMKISVQCP